KFTGTSTSDFTYIDTNYRPSNNTRIDFKTVLPSNRVIVTPYDLVTMFSAMTWTNSRYHNGGDLSFIFCLRTNNSSNTTFIGGSRSAYNANNKYEYPIGQPFLCVDYIEHTIEGSISTSQFIMNIDGTTNTYTPQASPWSGLDGTANTVSNICLGGAAYVNSSGDLDPKCFVEQNMYYFKIYNNDELVRDYIPVKRLSDNICGMYDKVNDIFYSSSNSTQFIGTSKSTPEYI
ncbi:MAG: hypothetical protein VZR10_05765, partial [Methanobrevibacter sp.]|nr:hypothetical protein [Methanobrevibacter sp.]